MPSANGKAKARVLITGGAGYIGSLMTRLLLEKGYAVTVLDIFKFRQDSLLECCHSPLFSIICGDCRDEALLARVLKNHDMVIPLAAVVGAPACDKDVIGAQSINVGAVRAIRKIISPSQIILFPTTNSGYGIGEKNKFCTEETPLRPISLYGRTKSEAEAIVREHANSVVFRLATSFGVSPRMRTDLLVNDFVFRAVTDRSLVIFQGHFKRNYIHVRDICRVFAYAMENFKTMSGQVYNVGLEDANLSKIELAQLIQKKLPNFVYLEAPIGEDPDQRDYIVSNAKLLATGFRPQWSLEDGIDELIKCYSMLPRGNHANV